MSTIQIVGMTLGTILITAYLIWEFREARRDEREVKGAWAEFVARRTGWRLDWARRTLAHVPIVVRADTPPGATLLEDALDPGTLTQWNHLRSLRRSMAACVWPIVLPGSPPRRGEGHRMTISWPGRERDPAILEAAVDLLEALATRPPARVGPGTSFVPYFLRE